MKIASWNVNSLRVRLEHVLDFLAESKPDVLGLQELKMPDEDFPEDIFLKAGYKAIWSGQKTYNGVAILYRDNLEASDVIKDIPDFSDPQRRVLAAEIGGVNIVNLYVPNGSSIDSDKYVYKLSWLDALIKWLSYWDMSQQAVAVMGDFNIAPEDEDVHSPKDWEGQVHVSEPERERLSMLLEMGLEDSFRLFDQAEDSFSWWDYRRGGFQRNRGLRIDLILLSSILAEQCEDAGIDVEPRAKERPSDHAPVWVKCDL